MVDFAAIVTRNAIVRRTLTPDIALVVRRWRVDDGHSFSGIARLYHEHYDAEITSGDRVSGLVICMESARLCGQSHSDPPWTPAPTPRSHGA